MKRPDMIRELKSIILKQSRPHPLRVGIDGVDGVGKTYLAHELANAIRERHVIRVSIDGFHHPRETRYLRGRLSPEGYYHDSFDYQKIADVLLKPLGDTSDLHYRTAIFDYRTNNAIKDPIMIAQEKDILIMDGIFLSRPELRNYWDIRIFIDAPFAVTVPRAILRDREKGTTNEQYEKRYVPAQKLYFEECQPKKNADIIIDNSDFENPSMQILMNPA